NRGWSPVAGLRQMDLVADPTRTALLGVASFAILRRLNHDCGRWQPGRSLSAPTPLLTLAVELRQPDLPQRLDRRHLAQARWRSRGIDRFEQLMAIGADLLGISGALRLGFWQPIIVHARAVSHAPRQRAVLKDPLGRGLSQDIERVLQSSGDVLQSVERAN